MADKNTIIAAKVQLDTSQASASAKTLGKDVSHVKAELKDTGNVAATTGKNLSATGGSFKNIKDQINTLPGPLGNAQQGVTGLNAAFNVLKANPIIAVIALIAGLVVALFQKFKQMEGVSDSLGRAFGALGTLFSAFIDKILTPLIDGFTFLVDLIVKSATFIADIFSPGLAAAAERGAQLADALDELNDAEAESALRRAESNRLLQEARSLAEDANVPIKERIAALQEAGRIETEETQKSIKLSVQRAQILAEQIAIEKGAQKSLIDDIRSGSVERLKIARNTLFAMKNIDKEQIKAIDELIIQAEDEGARLASINKETITKITTLQREEEAKRKAAAEEARQKRQEAEQKLAEFNSKLRQLQQDNELSQIKDGYEKELRALELRIANEKKANADAVKDRKLTRQQAALLDAELDRQANLRRAELTDKHNKEAQAKEETYQKALAKLKQDILLGGIVDARQLEQEQLRNAHEQSLADAQKQYADDAAKLAEYKALIDEQYRQQQDKLNRKYQEEDDKKQLEKDLAAQEAIVAQRDADFEARRAAVDAEQQIIQAAFDKKLISEQDYTNKIQALSDKRQRIDEAEAENKFRLLDATSNALNAASDIVGKNTVAGKALAAAASLINTYASIAAQLRAFAGVPIPGYAIIQALATAAVGFKSVKDILSVKVPGSSGGGSVPGASASAPLTVAAPIAPQPTSTKIIDSGENDATKAPIRAYVVEYDNRNAADRTARLERAARLGG